MSTHSPLAQFEIKTLIPLQLAGYDISFTNSSLYMVLSVLVVAAFVSLGMRKRALVPGRFQAMVEMSYNFVANMISENAGKEAIVYFPLIFSLFMFVLLCNLLGLTPYSFTVTSHIIVTFALAAFIFVGVTLISIAKHGLGKFLHSFLPEGVPLVLAPMIYFIEFFSYLIRPITLSVRLAANMMVGHTMLKVIAGFVVMLGAIGGWVPLAMLVAFTGFELFVAVLQAYIFSLLVCVYLNQALHLH